MLDKTLGDKVLELRTQKNMTQKELGEAIGVTHLSILKYEKGENKPRRKTLIKIAEYFNVSIDYFYEQQYEPMKGLVSIVHVGGPSSNTFSYRLNLSNKWMQIMGISTEDRLVDVWYKDKVIIIQKSGDRRDYNPDYEKSTVTVKISHSGGGSTKGTKSYMVVLPVRWMKEMQITNDAKENRTVLLEFDGNQIVITKKE